MCGIAGVVLKDKRKHLNDKMKLDALTLLEELQDRGRSAWGVYIEKSGKHNSHLFCGEQAKDIPGELFKMPNSLTEYLNNSKPTIYLDNVHTMLMHTRASTTGDPKDNKNNHPFNTKDFILAHNGVIRNHTEILKKHKIETDIECDSYAILACIQYHYNKNNNVLESIKKMAKEILGSYACWLYHKETKDIYLFRNSTSTPLEYMEDKLNGAFWFASDDDYIVHAFNDGTELHDVTTLAQVTIFRLRNGELEDLGSLPYPTHTDSNYTSGRRERQYNNYSSGQLVDTSEINESLINLFRLFEIYDTDVTDVKTGIYVIDRDVVLLVKPEKLMKLLDKAGFERYKQKTTLYNEVFYQYEISPMEDINKLVEKLVKAVNIKTGEEDDDDIEFTIVSNNDTEFDDAFIDLADTFECGFEITSKRYVLIYPEEKSVPNWIKQCVKKNGLQFQKDNRLQVKRNNNHQMSGLRGVLEDMNLIRSGINA